MIIASIDPSLTGTGITVLDNGRPVLLRKIKSSPDGKSDTDRAARVVALRHLIVQTIRPYKPDIIIIEGPAYNSTLGSACDRNALWHYLVHEFGVAGKIRGEHYAGVPPKTLKRFVTGNGNADKKLIVPEVQSWFPEFRCELRDDNVADSTGLAVLGAVRFGDPIPLLVQQFMESTTEGVDLRRRTAVEVVQWPVMV